MAQKFWSFFRPTSFILLFVATVVLFVAAMHPFTKENSLWYSNERETCEVVVGWRSVTITSQLLIEGCSESIGCRYNAHIMYGFLGGAVRSEQPGPENDGQECLEFASMQPGVPLAVRQTIQGDILLKRRLERTVVLP